MPSARTRLASPGTALRGQPLSDRVRASPYGIKAHRPKPLKISDKESGSASRRGGSCAGFAGCPGREPDPYCTPPQGGPPTRVGGRVPRNLGTALVRFSCDRQRVHVPGVRCASNGLGCTRTLADAAVLQPHVRGQVPGTAAQAHAPLGAERRRAGHLCRVREAVVGRRQRGRQDASRPAYLLRSMPPAAAPPCCTGRSSGAEVTAVPCPGRWKHERLPLPAA